MTYDENVTARINAAAKIDLKAIAKKLGIKPGALMRHFIQVGLTKLGITSMPKEVWVDTALKNLTDEDVAEINQLSGLEVQSE